MMKVGVVGATGYTGIELVQYLLKHPKVQLNYVTSQQYVGQPLAKVYPSLNNRTNLICEMFSVDLAAQKTELIFLALPHGESMAVVPELLNRGVKVIDLGADFRLKNSEIYPKWYGNTHLYPELLKDARYGLTELFRKDIAGAKLVANPGCYATATALGLAPIMTLQNAFRSISVDAKSGVTGAGKKLTETTHFPDCNENFSAYRIAKHQHIPEIEQTLSQVHGKPIQINFVTHLLPVNRGILTTQYIELLQKKALVEWRALYEDFYKNEFFVRIIHDPVPNIMQVVRSNFCDIGVYLDERTNFLIVISVIDNLVKGAAGQAIQNMNLICGWPEATALV